MATPTDIKYLAIVPEVPGGRPSIAGHCIGVIHVATRVEQGVPPAEITDVFGLSLAEIHAALACCYAHHTELDRPAAEDDARLAKYTANDHSPLADEIHAKLRTRLGETTNDQAATRADG